MIVEMDADLEAVIRDFARSQGIDMMDALRRAVAVMWWLDYQAQRGGRPAVLNPDGSLRTEIEWTS